MVNGFSFLKKLDAREFSGHLQLKVVGFVSGDARFLFGSGNDELIVTGGVAQGAVIDGGAGENVLTIGDSKHLTVAAKDVYKNFQVLRVSGNQTKAYDTENLRGVVSYDVAGGVSAGQVLELDKLAAAPKIVVSKEVKGTLKLSLKAAANHRDDTVDLTFEQRSEDAVRNATEKEKAAIEAAAALKVAIDKVVDVNSAAKEAVALVKSAAVLVKGAHTAGNVTDDIKGLASEAGRVAEGVKVRVEQLAQTVKSALAAAKAAVAELGAGQLSGIAGAVSAFYTFLEASVGSDNSGLIQGMGGCGVGA